MNVRTVLVVGLCAVVIALLMAGRASAAPPTNAPNPGAIAGGQRTAAAAQPQHKQHPTSNGNCSALALALNLINPSSHCNLGAQAANGIPQLPGDASSAAAGLAGSAMDQATTWMVQAARTLDGDVMDASTATTTPELTAPWYQQEFGYLAFFGAALAGLVALLGIISAAVRGDPNALGEILYGVLRAGLITAMVISLTLLALQVADGISSAIVAHMPKQFFQSLASAWAAKGWGGLGASALAFVAALVEVLVAFMLWIELLFRDAAIYIAVLFFPFTLAMAIWPAVSGAHSKLIRTLGIFIGFKPAALIVMMAGANLLLGGVSFAGGVGRSAGTILAGLAVLAMAAFAPWALLHLVGLESGVMGASSGSRRTGLRVGSASGSGTDTGAVGGELFGGAIGYGGASAAMNAAAGGGRSPQGHVGGPAAIGRGTGGGGGAVSGAGSAIGGQTSRRMLPGPVAAAAGLLPAGWQAAQSVASAGQTLASHGAARVHTAAGHSGSRPPSPSFVSGRSGGSPGNGRASEPSLPYVPPPPPNGTAPPATAQGHAGNGGAPPPVDPGSPTPGPAPPPQPPSPEGPSQSLFPPDQPPPESEAT